MSVCPLCNGSGNQEGMDGQLEACKCQFPPWWWDGKSLDALMNTFAVCALATGALAWLVSWISR